MERPEGISTYRDGQLCGKGLQAALVTSVAAVCMGGCLGA